MSNPYISRGPVREPAMFFGRRHELNEIAAFMRGNQSVSIIGPRKIGKTSLLFQLMRPESWAGLGLDAGNLFVYLDCEVLGEGDHAQIFGQLAHEMAMTLDERGLPPEPALETAASRPSRLSFEAAVRKLNQRGLRVVLILDEFERLSTNTQLDVNFFNALRSAAGRYQLVFLTASARPLIELTYAERAQDILSSPFFNIFAPLFLGLLDESAAWQLMRQPAAAAGVTFPPASEAFILDYVGGHPLALQVVCFHAFEVCGAGGEDPPEIERRTARELQAHFQYYWRNLTPTEQATLNQLAGVELREQGDTTLRGVLRDLVQKCLLVRLNGGYRYPSRAWAEFVALQAPASASSPPETASLTGLQFGPYEVLEPLGRGGMADVYKGYHPRLDRTVAIKVLPAGVATEASFRQRFEREARAVAALRHPNIVQVYDFGDNDGIYYMVMEYIAGQDLARLLHQAGRLPLAEALPLLRDVANALDYAHAQGLVHRDIKPSNVMLQPAPGNGQRAILTDFGIVRLLGRGTEMTQSTIMGTLDYMAPEQISSSRDVDRRADVYALGVMIYQLLTGRLPFDGGKIGEVIMAHLQQPPPDPRTFLPELPPAAAKAIMTALAKDPDQRQPGAGELVAALA